MGRVYKRISCQKINCFNRFNNRPRELIQSLGSKNKKECNEVVGIVGPMQFIHKNIERGSRFLNFTYKTHVTRLTKQLSHAVRTSILSAICAEVRKMIFLRYICFLTLLVAVRADFNVSTHDLKVLLHQREAFSVYLTKPVSENVTVSIDIQHKDLISVEPSEFNVTNDTLEVPTKIYVTGIAAGHSTLNLNVVSSDAPHIQP
ncbi:cystinosin isoform X1 [Vespula squamosa]|uniref:Cystinosin isoform X1 n=1 Tax=Vespula squamosa TaxID=30214 RepID=A0ABD1ZYM3_VESSQ